MAQNVVEQKDDSFYIPESFTQIATYMIKENGVLGSFAKYIQYKKAIKEFLTEEGANRKDRKYVYEQFSMIDKKVKCLHYPYQFLLMAKYILELKVPGPIVECGCYKGGSTTKLSLLAKLTGRKLYVCDSFQGLPAPKLENETDMHGLVHGYTTTFHEGEFSVTMDVVKNNITKYGCIDVCEFVPGFYENSLPHLDVAPAFVFIDVDLVTSARDCFKNLWPKLPKGALWFTHEAAYREYIYGIMDPKWWREALGECPPTIIGAGTGVSHLAQSIAYMEKM